MPPIETPGYIRPNSTTYTPKKWCDNCGHVNEAESQRCSDCGLAMLPKKSRVLM